MFYKGIGWLYLSGIQLYLTSGYLFFFCFPIRGELTQGLSAPKRIKKDLSVAQRPLRVHRFSGEYQHWGKHLIHFKKKKTIIIEMDTAECHRT